MSMTDGGQQQQGLPGGVTINVPQQQPSNNAPNLNTQNYVTQDEMFQRIEAARKEEKDKLYEQLTQQKQSLDELLAERQRRQDQETAAEQAAREAEEQQRQEQMSAQQRYEEQLAQQNQRMVELQTQFDTERALREKDAQLMALTEYKMQRLAQERENVIPDLDEFVRGNTPEEIDRSIEVMKAKSAKMVAEAAEAYGQQPGGQRQVGSLPVSSGPPLDMQQMAGQDGQRTLTPEDIRDMPLEEWSQIRGPVLNAMSQRVREQGPYAP